jgi:DNA-binding MarR family transcriptional regulator
MNKGPEPSFEILHLISALLVRFNSILKKSKLDEEQIYILAFIKSHGEDNQSGKKIILRSEITKILKEVFKCTDNQVSGWVNGLCTNRFLGEMTLDRDEKALLFSTRKGRNKALYITKSGVTKFSTVINELKKLHKELVRREPNLLRPPGMEDYGDVAKGIMFFLSQLPDSD